MYTIIIKLPSPVMLGEARDRQSVRRGGDRRAHSASWSWSGALVGHDITLKCVITLANGNVNLAI